MSADAFAHALRIVLAMKGKLYLVHIAESGRPDEHEWFPHVRETLVQWRLLRSGDAQVDVAPKLGIKVAKYGLEQQDPLRGLLRFLDTHPSDLLVLATHGRDGLARWLQGSIAEGLSRRAHMPTLFLPPSARGFVDEGTGEVRLRRVLVPVDHAPSPAHALSAIQSFVGAMSGQEVHLELMHVGQSAPGIRRAADGAPLSVELASGEPVGTVVQMAKDRHADLIAMPTAGRRGFLDALRGSTTERVLRQAPCPVLAVPAR